MGVADLRLGPPPRRRQPLGRGKARRGGADEGINVVADGPDCRAAVGSSGYGEVNSSATAPSSVDRVLGTARSTLRTRRLPRSTAPGHDARPPRSPAGGIVPSSAERPDRPTSNRARSDSAGGPAAATAPPGTEP